MAIWLKGAAATAVTSVLVVGLWVVAYPDRDDPKNIKYVLWKHDLYHDDPENMVYAFAHDASRNELIAGRSEAELSALFGYLKRPSEAGPRLQRCFEGSDWNHTDARFIRDTDIIVVFENGRAKDAWVFKPC